MSQAPSEAEAFVRRHLSQLARVASAAAEGLDGEAAAYAERALATLRTGGKLIFCGNGGSASTAEHVAAEYVVRFRRRRRSLPAVALTSNSAVVTAGANDFGYEEVFARSLEGLAGEDDLVILHSTSGDSPNVLRAAARAGELGLPTVGLLAGDGGAARSRVDVAIVVPTDDTARAQELHLAVEHAVVDRVDAAFAAEEEA